MKGRETKGAPSADLLVCFPSRAHLTLMPPKTSCSPARPSDAHKRRTPHHHHLLKKPSTRGGGQASPVLWAKTKPSGSEISEPTSPKVTCAGQIKVRPRTGSCKNWQSVMEEIERIHKSKRNKKKQSSWVEALGFKKEVMQFLTCLRSIRFDFRCFGSFPEVTSDDEDEEEEGDDREYHNEKRVSLEGTDSTESSRTVFSKWFMVLQENQNNCSFAEKERVQVLQKEISADDAPSAPPPNALLLMRCRSAPAKTWLEEQEEEEEEEEREQEEEEEEERNKITLAKLMMEDEEMQKKKNENLVVMRYDSDHIYKLSTDIAKETWVVGGIRDPFSRSRSWKR